MKSILQKFKWFIIGGFSVVILTGGIAYAASVFTVQQGGTGITSTTKGDLLVGTSSLKSLTKLSVGSNGQCLQASSSQASGLVWASCATGSTGITTLNGLTGATQTFATGTAPTGLDLFITSAGSTHTFVNALQAGYNIPLSASTTNWNNLYNNVLSRLVVATGTTGTIFNISTSTNSVTINIPIASASNTGQLSSTDWSTFNGKQAAGNYITALTGDVTASGPGSVAATLATVNSNTGSWGSSTAIPNFTVNGKGLITVAGTNVVVAPAGTLTGATLAANVLASSLTSVGTLSALTVSGQTTLGNSSSTNTTVSGNMYLTGLTSQPCIGTSAAGLLQAGTCGGSGTVSGGTTGFVTTWASSTGLTFGTLRDNGTVSGVNATSSTVSFNVQGTAALNPFNVASSTGTSLLTVLANGNVGVNTAAPVSKFVVTDLGHTLNFGNLSGNPNYMGIGYDGNVDTSTGILYSNGTGSGSTTIVSNVLGSVSLNTGNVAQLLVTAGGLVGINSTTPSTRLAVKGSGTVDPFDVASSSGTSILRISALSRVGIGTSSPASTFAVQGTAAQTVNLFSVASSTNASVFSIAASGDALFKSAVNSATALQVQNSSGQAVLTVDTTSIAGTPSSYPLTVASSTGASLVGWNGYGNQIMLGNGMVYSSSTAPSIATSTGAGSASGSASITGGNMAGEVTLNAGTSPAANAVLFTITPTNNNPANKLICTFTPSNINAASTTANSTLVFASSTASQIALVSGTSGLTASVTYKWMYHCGGY